MDTKNIEQRFINLELRADAKTIGGYAAVFYNGDKSTQYQLWADTVERIDKNCFNNLINGNSDVIASYNHDFTTLLGRRSAGTLNLSVDNIGLRWEVPFDNQDADHVRIARKIQKGELSGCSFAFNNAKDTWTNEGTTKVRTLQSVDVAELGPVVFCAYTGTKTFLRSAEQSLELFETQQKIKEIEAYII